MIRVLVAEDEYPLLRGISKLIEKLDSDFQVVKMAATGKEALDYLKQETVDIVFTDINMPVIDGLQILKYIKENVLQTMSVIISGYQDFSYAQQSVKYGAKRYLLKPIDKEELYSLLQELKESILSQKENEKNIVLKQVLFERNSGKFQEEELWNDRKKVEFNPIYPIYMIAKSYCRGNVEEDVFENLLWNSIEIKEWIEEHIKCKKTTYLYLGKYANEIILLLESKENIDTRVVIDELLNTQLIQTPVAVAFGSPCGNLMDLSKSIHQLRKQICMKWRYGKKEIIETDKKRSSFCMTRATEETLQYMVKNNKMKGLQMILKDLQKQMEEEKITQYDLELTLNKIILYIQAYQTVFSDEENESSSRDINDIIIRSDGLQEVFQEFSFWCQEFMCPNREESTENLVKRLDSYIQEHYTERITTKMLAQEFGLVPSYLSKLFREYKGVTPNHYIQDIRIEKSKEILVNYPEMMTKDVALMVGYVDSSYFSKVFKKSTDLYPSEYRVMKLS